jgi:hypothetical protein
MNDGARNHQIILVGVVHGDPEGYDKLIQLLRRLGPGGITVEVSDYSRQYRRRHQEQWQRQFESARQQLPPEVRTHLALQKVAAQIGFPFEARAAAAYAKAHGSPWHAIDLNAISREHLPWYAKGLLSPDNLRQLTATPDADWREYILQEYRRARRILEADWNQQCLPIAENDFPYGGERVRARGESKTDQYLKLKSLALIPQTTLREKVLAHRVARLAREWLKIVHVGGWEHLLRSKERWTMADFLARWRPQGLLLDDALELHVSECSEQGGKALASGL